MGCIEEGSRWKIQSPYRKDQCSGSRPQQGPPLQRRRNAGEIAADDAVSFDALTPSGEGHSMNGGAARFLCHDDHLGLMQTSINTNQGKSAQRKLRHLAGVSILAPCEHSRGKFNIGIVEHDRRCVPPKLHGDALHVAPASEASCLPTGVEPVNDTLRMIGCAIR